MAQATHQSAANANKTLKQLSERIVSRLNLQPRWIALSYLMFGLFALFVSDYLLARYVSEPLLGQLQAVKGAVEVGVTTVLIYALTSGRELQRQQDRDRLNQEREELQVLHRVLRHNLRNDLNVICGYAESLRAQVDATCTDEFQTILKTAYDMIEYTEWARRINQTSDQRNTVKTLDVTETVDRVLETHPQVTDAVSVESDLPDSALVQADYLFDDVVTELVSNAIEHNDSENPRVRIEVTPIQGPPPSIELWISDNGPGIPEGERKPLEEGNEDQLQHLSGLGLWFVKWAVQYSRGELRFENNEMGGTTAIINIPEA